MTSMQSDNKLLPQDQHHATNNTSDSVVRPNNTGLPDYATSTTSSNTATTNSTLSITSSNNSPILGNSMRSLCKSAVESDGDDDDENRVLEVSSNGRWQKHAQEVNQSHVPGIDATHLAMDTQEGVEVVWNQITTSKGKFEKQERDKLMAIFNNLKKLQHKNIVKLYDFWHSKDKNCLVFISEYMTAGSLKHFLNRAKINSKPIKTWKHWCRQILWALSYFHRCDPPIAHNNLTCNSIYIQHNGLVKIGCVDPDTIRRILNVRSINLDKKTCMHFSAPEYEDESQLPHPPGDIYAFGVCALEMLKLGISPEGSKEVISAKQIKDLMDSIEIERQKELVKKCCSLEPNKRPTAREALFHPALFEVHPLKLFAAHKYIEYLHCDDRKGNVKQINQINKLTKGSDHAYAKVYTHGQVKEFTIDQISKIVVILKDIHKYLDDVREGHFPLIYVYNSLPKISKMNRQISHNQGHSKTDQSQDRDGNNQFTNDLKDETSHLDNDENEEEHRRVSDITCEQFVKSDTQKSLLIKVKFEGMRRELATELNQDDTNEYLVNDLVENGFINKADADIVMSAIQQALDREPTLNEEPIIIL